MSEPDLTKTPTRRYYVDEGRGHDHLLRCHSCRALGTSPVLFKEGSCPKCGSRKFTEIVTLTPWEWFKIRVGYIDFDGRKEFLNEFRRS